MKVKALKTFPQLKEIFVKDDILEIEPVLRTEECVIHPGQTKLDKTTGKVVRLTEPIIAQIGDYNGYTLVTADGRRYKDSCIYGFVGNKKLSEMFIKI